MKMTMEFQAVRGEIAGVRGRRGLRRVRGGFTLLELLVVVTLVVVLLSLLLYAVGAARRSAGLGVELAAARQLLMGHAAYSEDHRGALIPGFYDRSGGLRTRNASGTTLAGQTAYRWPWRLAPYMDYNIRGLYLDKRLLEALNQESMDDYLVSLYPALGMNTLFVGGDSHPSGYGFNPTFESVFGKFYITRRSEALRPAELIVFASARSDIPYGPASPPIVEGFHRVKPPWFTAREWSPGFNAMDPPGDFGNVSLRHPGGQAAVGFLDGSTRALNEQELQDMRRWSNKADRADWMLTPGG